MDEENNVLVEIEPENVPIPRLSVSRERVGDLLFKGIKIPLTRTQFGETENLPPQREGIYYIVSNLVAQANPDRRDLLIVDDTVRDEQGRIIGCKSLSLNPYA